MTIYVNMAQGSELETVVEFPYDTKEERKYAKEMVNVYRISDPYSYYYLSRKHTKSWK